MEVVEQSVKRYKPTYPDYFQNHELWSKLTFGAQDQMLKEEQDIYNSFEKKFTIDRLELQSELNYDKDYTNTYSKDYTNTNTYRILKKDYFNNLTIHIYNPLNKPINQLVNHIKINSGLQCFYKLEGDIETHIKVLSQFINAKIIYNPHTYYTELSLGLIHNNILFGGYYSDTIIKLNLLEPNTDVKFYADCYNITNIFLKKFKYIGVDSVRCMTNTYSKILFNHPANALYLTDINPFDVKSIKMKINGEPIINISYDQLIQTNKNNYQIDSDQIIIVFDKIIYNYSNMTINFSRIDQVEIFVETLDSKSYTINCLNTNIVSFNKYHDSYFLYIN